MPAGDVKDQIIRELTTACKHLGAKSDLLGVACSYGDTLEDQEVLSMLREWNAHGVVHPQDPHAENMLRMLIQELTGDTVHSRKRPGDLEPAWRKAMKAARPARGILPIDAFVLYRNGARWVAVGGCYKDIHQSPTAVEDTLEDALAALRADAAANKENPDAPQGSV